MAVDIHNAAIDTDEVVEAQMHSAAAALRLHHDG